MGGDAFSSAISPNHPTLHTPRISPSQYTTLRSTLLSRIQSYFPHNLVETLREAPEKPSYGDIDFVVSYDFSNNTEDFSQFHDLARHIGAYAIIKHTPSRSCTFACFPSGIPHVGPVVEYTRTTSKVPPGPEVLDDGIPNNFVQIDLTLVPAEIYHWRCFQSSFGDTGTILGRMLRPAGLRVSHQGLSLRLIDLDDAVWRPGISIGDEKGLLHLSSDPEAIMKFLGMSVQKYISGFDTQQEYFEWLSEYMLLPAHLLPTESDSDDTKRLSYKKKRQQRQRPNSVKFFQEWLPARLAAEDQRASLSNAKSSAVEEPTFPNGTQRQLRHIWQEQAVDFFAKRKEFMFLQGSLLAETKSQSIAHHLKPMIAECSGYAVGHAKNREILRALRRWVTVSDNGTKIEILAEPHTDAESHLHHLHAENDHFSLRHPAETKEWISRNWESVRSCERGRDKT